jgi:hypothetical protein
MLISQMLRAAAITGNPQAVDASAILGRQGGRWAHQWVQDAYPHGAPPPRPAGSAPANPAESMRALATLHAQGVIDDAEYRDLRGRLAIEQPAQRR